MDLDVWRTNGRKRENRRKVDYVQMPDFVEIFGFFEGFLSSPCRRGFFPPNVIMLEKKMQRSRARQGCQKIIRTCDLKGPPMMQKDSGDVQEHAAARAEKGG